ncbi:MAG: hypothetical protein MUC94_05865 [bacterium]|nr:hypothetical protein [bacterium]
MRKKAVFGLQSSVSSQQTAVGSWQLQLPIGRITSHTAYANRQRDILWFTASPEKSDTKIYLLAPDDKVNYVRRQLPITPKLFWQYAAHSIEGINQEYGIAIGDIDSDGDDDICSINTSDKNHLLLFNGNRQIKVNDHH